MINRNKHKENEVIQLRVEEQPISLRNIPEEIPSWFSEQTSLYLFDKPSPPNYFRSLIEKFYKCCKIKAERNWTSLEEAVITNIRTFCYLLKDKDHVGAKMLGVEGMESMFEALYCIVVDFNAKSQV